jgi:hypothetical protein
VKVHVWARDGPTLDDEEEASMFSSGRKTVLCRKQVGISPDGRDGVFNG